MNDRQVNNMLFVIVVMVLSCVMLSVIGTLLFGLFNEIVDNTKIFEILAPAFQTIVGAFVGVIGGRQMASVSHKENDDSNSNPTLNVVNGGKAK
mgnify:CR=1 FL=1